MSRKQALLTIAWFCLFSGVVATSHWVFQRLSAAEKTSSVLNRSSAPAMRQIRDSALRLKECVHPETTRAGCEAETAALRTLLQNADTVQFDLYKPGYLDLFLSGNVLILRRRSCGGDDIAGTSIAWSAWSKADAALSQDQVKSGDYGGYQSFDAEGRRFEDTCLIVVVLPINDLKRLYISQLDENKTDQIWMMEEKW
jgi:hypothetical protein